MNPKTLNQTLRAFIFAGATAFALTGCMTTEAEKPDYNSDGQSAYFTSEVDQMGQTYSQIGGAAAMKSAAESVTITGELVIVPFTYQDDCQCFVRRATFSGMKGYERERIDSVKLYDASGATMNTFTPALIAKVIHTRNVTKSKNGRQADIRFDITVEIKTDGGMKKGVWNGTMTGTYNGQEFKNGSLNNVTRPWLNGRFGFPEAGTISWTRPVHTLLAEFLGDSKAKITITNKVNKKVHILWVDANYQETDPVAAQ